MHVVVIGAGIVGAAAAWELVKDGHAVTIVEPATPGGPHAASYGNGAWISPASILPMSMPGLWRKVPGYLTDRSGPLTIRWRALPLLAPWLLRFLRAGATVPKVEATARALASVLHDGPSRHAALAQEIGQPGLIHRTGLLYAYPDRAAFAAEALAWRLRADNGLRWQELDADALRRREPDLGHHYTFGILVDAGAHCADPGTLVAAIVDAAVTRGARIAKARATGFAVTNGRLDGVVTETDRIACDRAVIAAGIRSQKLALMAGDRIPLASERGYHAVIASPAAGPRLPIMPTDGKMANTMTPAGLRIAGQVELADVDDPPDWNRVEILIRHALATYPGLGNREDLRIERWMGHRPSTPDGLPVIGPARASSDIVHAFGHGHIGLAAGPVTGRIVADIIAGRTPGVDPAPFAARRFW